MAITCTNVVRMSPNRRKEVLSILCHSTSLDGHSIGFMSKTAFEQAIDRGDIQTLANNGDLVGYCWTTLSRVYPAAKIYICWVRPDARLILHGKTLIRHVAARCLRHGKTIVHCDVADDLAANIFWEALGFERVRQRIGGWSLGGFYRGRRINQYRKVLYYG